MPALGWFDRPAAVMVARPDEPLGRECPRLCNALSPRRQRPCSAPGLSGWRKHRIHAARGPGPLASRGGQAQVQVMRARPRPRRKTGRAGEHGSRGWGLRRLLSSLMGVLLSRPRALLGRGGFSLKVLCVLPYVLLLGRGPHVVIPSMFASQTPIPHIREIAMRYADWTPPPAQSSRPRPSDGSSPTCARAPTCRTST